MARSVHAYVRGGSTSKFYEWLKASDNDNSVGGHERRLHE
jgi:uncharacterized protein (DUF2252 family)